MFCVGTFVVSFVAAGLSSTFSPHIVLALPSPGATSPELAAIQNAAVGQEALSGVQFFLDENPDIKRVYVTPANRKSQDGVASTFGGSCTSLQHRYEITYKMPNVPPEKYFEAAMDGPQSAFFDWSYGNYVRLTREAEDLHKEQVNETAFIERHRQEFDAFHAATADKENADEVVVQAELESRALQQRLDRAEKNIILADTPEAREAMRVEYRALVKELRPQIIQTDDDLSHAKMAALQAKAKLLKASSAWRPYQEEHDHIKARIEESLSWQKAMQELAQVQFDKTEKALELAESIPAGYASAAYTIYGNEVDAVRQIIANAPSLAGYTVSEMPLNNVSLSMARAEFPYRVRRPAGTETFALANVGFVPEEKPFLVGSGDPQAARPAFTDSNGNVIPFRDRNAKDEGSGVFMAGISRAAWCTGSSERPIVEFGAEDGQGLLHTWTGSKYAARNRNILAQAVALNYDYYVAATPLAVDCNASIDKFEHFFKESHASRSWFSANAWEKEELYKTDETGINCVTTENPDGELTLEQQRVRTARIKQKAHQELTAEILHYTDATFTTSVRNTVLTPEMQKEILDRGPATAVLCRGFYYCEVSNVVLSAAQGLFGTSVNSSVVKDGKLHGEFKRSYRDSSYRRIPGRAAINLTVQ